jgi:hypothetical protein
MPPLHGFYDYLTKLNTVLAENAEHLMKELDQQYEGGTAPCLPSTSSFRSNERDTHRADKGPEDNTRPCGRRRTNHSASYNVSLQKAKEQYEFGTFPCLI